MEEKRCQKGTRKLNGKCTKGSYKIINDKKIWVFDVSNSSGINKTEKGTRKRCPRGTTEVIEDGIKYCISSKVVKEAVKPLVGQVKIPCGKRCPNKMRCKNGECVLSEKFIQPSVIEPEPPVIEPSVIEPTTVIEKIVEQVPLIKRKKNRIMKPLIYEEIEDIKPSKTPITEKHEYNHYLDSEQSGEMETLYPNLNDPNFNIKLSEKKEFSDIPFDNNIHDIKQKSKELCDNEKNKKEFEYLPHQLFVRNFLSQQTPYNSILLYHSVGTGKTLSAISIAEDMRYYLKQLSIRKKILIVCAPNVQDNFKRQFFDNSKLIESKKNNEKSWSINSGIGKTLLKEINPTINDTKETISKKIDKLRKKYYEFNGYVELGNEIEGYLSEGEELFKKKIRKRFNNTLIIIDEVHNIHNIKNDSEKKIKKNKPGLNILKIAMYADNVRFILLSATPIYNSYNEILFLANLMNLNDKRKKIEKNDVFDNDGKFKEQITLKNGMIKEGGKELLIRKLTGYVSFVRGENPYNFPFRVYPNDIPNIKERSILNIKYLLDHVNNI